MDFYIDRGEIIDIAKKIISCPSVNPPGDVTECAGVIMQILKECGIPAETVEYKPGAANVVARLHGKDKGKTLLLNGHFDVVPPGLNWSMDPFCAEIKDGNIYGRGASDMKAGIVSIIAAMAAVKRSGLMSGGEILFTAIADEETGSRNGTLALIENDVIKADYAIVAEPTNLRVENGQRGSRWIEVRVKGRAAHGGRPHLGKNAISYAARIVNEIDRIKYNSFIDNFEVGTPSISVTMIEGGGKVNIIPDECTISIDRRMIPGETEETVKAEITQIIDKFKAIGLDADLKFLPGKWDPFVISEQEPLVTALKEAFTGEMGCLPEIRGKAACTDASHINNYAGIPTVIFGPGNGELSHTANEYAEIDKIISAAKILASASLKLTQP